MPAEIVAALQIRFEDCWAKTTEEGKPGISVRDHCLNVGCVAESFLSRMLPAVRGLLPSAGASTLAALHDVGKVSPGFQAKCGEWLKQHNLSNQGCAWIHNSESDHAKVSQYALQQRMKSGMPNLWAAVVGAHHGRIKGERIAGITEADATMWCRERMRLIEALEKQFDKLPADRPSDAALWVMAGLIAVADWIGSDERYFPGSVSWPMEERKQHARDTVIQIGFGTGSFREGLQFAELFPTLEGKSNALQDAAIEHIRKPGLYVIEGPMGCGKTEAALAAAYNLVSQGLAGGIYFALPTQTTSNRIHIRVAEYLGHVGKEVSTLRLAHASSWLDDNQTLSVVPSSRMATEEEWESSNAGKTWFSSSKRALLTPFGVGTVDQALLGIVAAKHFFVRQFGLAGKVVILDEIHSYDLYTGTLIDALVKRLLELHCTVIILSATLTRERRRQLMGSAESGEYPLLATKADSTGVVETPVNPEPTKQIRVSFKNAADLNGEVLRRATGGECVLWIRNTVAEAQQTYLRLVAERPQDGPDVALLHARFPFFRREELEAEWMERLGKDSAKRPVRGCILVATQVVEQSVDIDADLLITDLAPTDMIFQRMGRLWRHRRDKRPCEQPEVWIEQPGMTLDALRQAGIEKIKAALGKSARVYAPYVLLRSLEQWQAVQQVALPGRIRSILEATYAPVDKEPDTWRELREDLEKVRDTMAGKALSAMQIWSNPALEDEEGVQTRYGQQKTVSLSLVAKAAEAGPVTEVTLLDGKTLSIPRYGFDFRVAKALHRNLVRIPLWCVRDCLAATPEWLRPYVAGKCVLGVLDGPCPGRPGRRVRVNGSEQDAQSSLYYRDDLGIVIERGTENKKTDSRGAEIWEDESCD